MACVGQSCLSTGDYVGIVHRVWSFIRDIGQHPIRLNIDTSGFVVNRIRAAIIAEANSLILYGIISLYDLDDGVAGRIRMQMSLNSRREAEKNMEEEI